MTAISGQRHRALILAVSGNLEIKAVPTQDLEAGELLVAPLKVGVCGTDLQILRGIRPDEATILGHEGVAEIVEVGTGVTEYEVGQQVVFNPVNPRDQDDILGHSTQGLFQERLVVPRSAVEQGLILPFQPGIPLILAPLVEPLGTVIYGQYLVGRICKPRSVAIIGAGSVGLLHALHAKAQSDCRVIIVHNSVTRLRWAVEQGIAVEEDVFLCSRNTQVPILDNGNGRGVDAAYVCTPRYSTGQALRLALRCVRDGGCIDLVGGLPDEVSIADLTAAKLAAIRRANCCGMPVSGEAFCYETQSSKAVWITGHRGTSARHLCTAMELLHQKPGYYGTVVSHVVSLKEALQVLNSLVERPSQQICGRERIKIVLDLVSKRERPVERDVSRFVPRDVEA